MTRPAHARPAPLKALLIDLDGTCCDTHGLIRASFDHAIRTHLGQPAPPEVWLRSAGLPLDSILSAAYAHFDAELSPELRDTVRQTYRSYMSSRADEVRAFPEIDATLRWFKARNVRLALVTTKYRAMALRHLQTSALESLFDVIIPGDECDQCKPDPEPFLRALHALDIPAASAAGVGDSQHDIVAARGAGLYTVAACWGTDTRMELLATQPDSVAERPSDLLKLGH
jgi:pyrophosphatase PpaX